MTRFLAAAAALAALGGCGTILDGTDQSVEVEASDGRVALNGATCAVLVPGKAETTVTTPARLVVPRHGSDLQIACSHPGYVTAHGRLFADFNARAEYTPYFSFIQGTSVEAATGGMFRYRDKLTIVLLRDPRVPVRAQPVRRAAPAPAPAKKS
jgi:hypothetical protein